MDNIIILKELKEKGVYVLENFLDENQLKSLNSEFDTFLSEEMRGVLHTDYSKGKCARVSDFEKNKFPATSEVFFSKEFRTLAEAYLQSDVGLNSDIFVVKDVVGSKHIANDLHYDVIKTFKFFIYLTDTTKENGAFECVPKSHIRTAEYRAEKPDEINFENRYASRDLDTQDFAPPLSMEGKAGALIIFDTDVWHRAGIVASGERRVMRGHTRPISKNSTSSKKTSVSILGRIKRKLNI